MSRLLGSIGFFVALASVELATSAHVLADRTETVFLQALANGGIDTTDGDELIAEAKAACTYMSPSNGGSVVNEARFLQSQHPDWSMRTVGYFMGAARPAFCGNQAEWVQ